MNVRQSLRPSALLLAFALHVLPAAAQQSSPLTEVEQDAVRALILETIRDNPAVIVEAIIAYQEQAQADAESRRRETIAALANDLRADPNAPVLGNPDGQSIVVEFFDYNCPYCRRSAPIVMSLIEENPDLRVVMREWPVLGADSEEAARASLAARAQGSYAAFHEALMAQPRANVATIRRAAEQAGLNYDRLQADMGAAEVDAHLAQSRTLAQQLGITGTPSFVIGETLVPGLMTKEDLADLIAEAGGQEGER